MGNVSSPVTLAPPPAPGAGAAGAAPQTRGLARLPNELVSRVLCELDPLALFGVAQLDARLRGLCQKPRVRAAVCPLPPGRARAQASAAPDAAVPSWPQVVAKAHLESFALEVARGRVVRLPLSAAHTKTVLSADGRWVLAEGAAVGARLFDLARRGRAIDLATSQGLFSPDGRLLLTYAADDDVAHLYDLQAPTLAPYALASPRAEVKSFRFSAHGQWLEQCAPRAQAKLWPTAAILAGRAASAAVPVRESVTFGGAGRLALAHGEDWQGPKGHLYDADASFGGAPVGEPRPERPQLRTRSLELFGAWLFATVDDTKEHGSSIYVARADVRPWQWHEVASLETAGWQPGWWCSPTPWTDRVFARRRSEIPLLLDLARGQWAATAGISLPDWAIDGVVPYECGWPHVYEEDEQMHLTLPDGTSVLYGGDPKQGLRLRARFPPLRRVPSSPYDTAGSLSLRGPLGRDHVLLHQSIRGTSGMPMPFWGGGDPEACRLLVAHADAPEQPLHTFVHSGQRGSATRWSASLGLLAQTLGPFDNTAYAEGSRSPGQTFLRRLTFDPVAEVSVELEAGRHFVDFLEAARAVVLREPGGELCIAPLGGVQAPFEYLRGGVTPPGA